MIVVIGTLVAGLLVLTVVFLHKFMRDMAAVERDLIGELREMKGLLAKIHEKQL